MAKKDKDRESRELTPWQAFSDLSRWERDMEQLFENFFERRMGSRSGGLWPVRSANLAAVDLYEDNNELVAKVELPGLDKDDIDVSISDHTLTVKAEKKQEEEIKDKNYYRVERSHGAIRRSVELPADVETENIKAIYKNGLLEIRMPRAREEQNKQKRIEVQS
jgi:HSP20 family protein